MGYRPNGKALPSPFAKGYLRPTLFPWESAMKLRVFSVLLPALALVGCGDTDRTDSKNSNKIQRVTEMVNCKGTTIESLKTPDGIVRSQIEEELSVKRDLQILDEGRAEQAKSEGTTSQRIYVLSGDKKELSSSQSYTYLGTRTSKIEKLEDGTRVESGLVETFSTGRDGFQFTDENGQRSPTRKSKFSYEAVTRETDGKSVQLSYKYNGEDISLRDEVTTIITENGIKIETTVLQKPYVETVDDMERVTESFTYICYTQRVN